MTEILKTPKGFTLIEVLIAMAIFAMSFLVLVDSQNMSIRNSATAKRLTTATLLAQRKMAEVRLKYEGKNIAEIPAKEEGEFEAPHSKYRWEETSRDFHYDLSFLADMAASKEKEEEEESPLVAYLPKISQFIKDSVKEVTVTILWKEGSQDKSISLTTHFFNYKKEIGL